MYLNLCGLNNKRVINFNKNLILFYLYIHSSLSISAIAKLCSLSIPAISRLVSGLCAEGKLVIENDNIRGCGNSAGVVKIKHQDEVILCLDVTSFNINALICNSLAMPINDIESFELKLTTKEHLLNGLLSIIEYYKNKLQLDYIKVAIGMHGQVDRISGISLVMPQAPWHESLQIKFMLEQKTACEILIDNDCVMRALAQKWDRLRRNKELQDICIINLDYGIGSAFVINNEIYRGSIYGSGQIGHTIVDPYGKQCSCGRFGCLETIASEQAVIRQINSVYTVQNENLKLDFQEIIELYHQDQSTIKTIVNIATLNVGRTIYNFLNINKIYLYGSMCLFGEKFLEQILAPINIRPFDQKDQIKDYATLITYGKLSYKEQLAGIAYLYAERDIYPTLSSKIF